MTLLDRFKTVWRPYYAPINAIIPYIENGTSILEIGCGMGPVIFSIAGQRHVSDYLGIDIDPRAVDIARRANRTSRFSFAAGTLFDIPKAQVARFRTLICFDVLHHLPGSEKQAFISYLSTAATVGTVIIIKDFDARPRMDTLANDLTDWLSTRSAVSYLPRQDLITQLKDDGFRILNLAKQSMWVWRHLIVAARKTGA